MFSSFCKTTENYTETIENVTETTDIVKKNKLSMDRKAKHVRKTTKNLTGSNLKKDDKARKVK